MFSACESPKTEIGRGKVNLAVMEPVEADEEISAIYISIKKIELKGPNGWKVYKEFRAPLLLNLLEGELNNNYFLGEKLLPAGHYKEARLILSSDDHEDQNIIATSGGFLQYKDGEMKAIYIPKESKDGIKAKGEFILPAEGVVNITLKFDIRKGLVKEGNNDNYLLKPIIKMEMNNDAGLLDGEFAEYDSLKKVAVFAYPSSLISKNNLFNPSFPDANVKSSGSTVIKKDGKFIVSFLQSGKYDLYFCSYDNDGNFQHVLGRLEGIEIESGQTTKVRVSSEILF